MEAGYRVSYINKLDGNKRVLIGGIDKQTAERIAASASNKKDPMFYMGKGVKVEADDGTPDGGVING